MNHVRHQRNSMCKSNENFLTSSSSRQPQLMRYRQQNICHQFHFLNIMYSPIILYNWGYQTPILKLLNLFVVINLLHLSIRLKLPLLVYKLHLFVLHDTFRLVMS